MHTIKSTGILIAVIVALGSGMMGCVGDVLYPRIQHEVKTRKVQGTKCESREQVAKDLVGKSDGAHCIIQSIDSDGFDPVHDTKDGQPWTACSYKYTCELEEGWGMG